MRLTLRTAAWAAFFVLSGLFLIIIGYGAITAEYGYQHLFLLERNERVLAATTAEPGVRLDLRIVEMREAPALQVRLAGLDRSAPVRVWLTDDARKPAPLGRPVEVNAEGRTDARVPLPERGLRLYRWVTGMQGNRVVFRAPLS